MAGTAGTETEKNNNRFVKKAVVDQQKLQISVLNNVRVEERKMVYPLGNGTSLSNCGPQELNKKCKGMKERLQPSITVVSSQKCTDSLGIQKCIRSTKLHKILENAEEQGT